MKLFLKILLIFLVVEIIIEEENANHNHYCLNYVKINAVVKKMKLYNQN